MNLIDVQNNLKGLSDQQLAGEMQSPTGVAPQFLVLSELQRRKRVRDEFQAQQAQGNQTTVAQDAVAAAGVPQAGIAPMAQALAPKTDITQNTGIAALAPQAAPEPQRMASGGMVRKMADGRAVYTDPAIMAMASRVGKSVDEYLASLGPAAAQVIQQAEARATRNRMVGTEPADSMATYRSVNPSYTEDLTSRFPVSGFSEPGPDLLGNTRTPMDQAPPSRPYGGMDYRADAIAKGVTQGGRGGLADAALAYGVPNLNIDSVMPPYIPGPGAATELQNPSVLAALTRDPSFQDKLMAQAQDQMLAGQAAVAEAAAQGPTILDLLSSGSDAAPPTSPIGLNRADAYKEARAAAKRINIDSAPEPYLPGPAAATELNTPAIRRALGDMDTGGAGLATPLKEAAAAATANSDAGQSWGDWFASIYAPSQTVPYDEGAVFDPATGVPISGGVSGAPVDTHSTGNMWEDLTLSDAARDQLNDIRAKTAAAKGEAPAKDAEAVAKDATAETKAAEDKPTSDTTTSSSSSASYSGPAGGSDYEKALADALKRTEKRAEQDKWLSLAQMGMALMSSKQPTLGGALGEAGLAGLSQYQQTRDAAEKDRLGIMGTQFDLDMARQKMALARAQAASSGSGDGLTANQRLTQFRELSALADTIRGSAGPDDMDAMKRADEIEAMARKLLGLPPVQGASKVKV